MHEKCTFILFSASLSHQARKLFSCSSCKRKKCFIEVVGEFPASVGDIRLSLTSGQFWDRVIEDRQHL